MVFQLGQVSKERFSAGEPLRIAMRSDLRDESHIKPEGVDEDCSHYTLDSSGQIPGHMSDTECFHSETFSIQ